MSSNWVQRDKPYSLYPRDDPPRQIEAVSIEIWFSILVRKVIRRGNFRSTEELKARIEAFIEYFNRTLAKPFRWTYQGKPLVA